MNRSIASPLDLAGCVLWLDSTNSASITRDGSNKVSQWSDLSGAGNHPVQAVGANQPTYVASAVAGMPAVQFFNAGGGTWLESATGAVTGSSAHTMFVVVRNVDLTLSGLYGGLVCWGSPQTTYNCSDIMVNTSVSPPKWTFGGPGYGLNGATTVLAGVTYVATKRYTPGNPGLIVGRVNGSGDQSGQFTLNIGDTKIEIGRSSTFTTRSPDAYILGVVIFNRALSDGEIVLVERYLQQRYTSSLLPSDIPSLVAWYQAGQGIHLEGATQKVEQWDDLSGLGHHLLQATTGLKPLLSTMPNGLPAVLFDGVDDLMKATFTLAQPISICAVIKDVVPGVYSVHDCAFAGINSTLSMTLLLADTPLAFFLGGNAGANCLNLLLAGSNIALTQYNCFSGVLDSVRSSFRINGATRMWGDAGSSAPGGVSLGAYANGTSATNISVSEMAIYNRVLSEAELLFVERYMTARSKLLAV